MNFDKLKIVLPEEAKVQAQPIPEDNLLEIYKLGLLMKQICETANGIGLSAVQLGIPWQLFIVKIKKEVYDFFVNCSYEGVGAKTLSIEGCLTLSGGRERYKLDRFKKIRLKGKQLESQGGKLVLSEIDTYVEKFKAVVIQHEIDHQQGILISDVGIATNFI
jgi:peptide deformylase